MANKANSRTQSTKPKTVKVDPIEAKMVDLLDTTMPLITVIYGKPGSGKTTVMSSFPKPLLILSVKDKGSESAKSKHIVRGDIKVLEVNSFDDAIDYIEWVLEKPDKWATVAIDHMTALQEHSHDKVRDEAGKDQMSQPMFGTSSGQMKDIISLMVELSDHNIEPVFICQDRLDSGDGDGEDQLMPEVGPNLMPKLATHLCAASRIIIQTYLGESVRKIGTRVERDIEFRVRTGPNPYYITKMTRPAGTPCPKYLVNDLENGGNIYNDMKSIVAGNFVDPSEEPVVKKAKKRSTSSRSRSRK